MQQVESMGFIQHWGFSRQLNVAQPHKDKQNILLLAASDLRHILQTCLENYNQEVEVYYIHNQLTFYVVEKNKESFCRTLLLLLIMHIKNFTFRERTDLFLEFFGNTFIRDSSQLILDKLIPYLDDLIAKETKHVSGLNQIIDLKECKFKDRDELVEVIRSWYSTQEFQMEKLRDQRLRYHYGIRYDARQNLVDWDYQMNLTEYAPIIHFYHYKEWRKSGIAFESRFATYPTPNRTLSSYIQGKNKTTRDNLLVRGYWGDITISPYLSFGIYTSILPEKNELFKLRNKQQVSHSVTVSEFNIQHMIQLFDSRTEYHLDFDEKPKKQKQQQEEKEQKQDLETIKEQDEEHQEKQQEEDQEIVDDKENNQTQKVVLNTTQVLEIYTEPLWVFKDLKLKIIPIFEDIDKLYDKKKFQKLFDSCFIGFTQSAKIKDKKINSIFKDDADIVVESARYIVPLKKEEKLQAYTALLQAGQETGWKVKTQDTDFITFNIK